MKEYIPHLIIGIICIALGYFICLQVKPKPPQIIIKTEYVKGDTVFITDTVRIKSGIKEKAIVNNDTARTQVVIDTDSIKSVTDNEAIKQIGQGNKTSPAK